MTITPAQLEEWKRLAEAATPGEWTQRLANDGTGDRGIKAPSKRNVIAECFADMDYDGERALSGCKANAAFIAASRTALPALIAEVERLNAEKAKLREALTWINNQRYEGRNTVNPDNAFEQFAVLNKKVIEVMDRARLALAETGEKPDAPHTPASEG